MSGDEFEIAPTLKKRLQKPTPEESVEIGLGKVAENGSFRRRSPVDELLLETGGIPPGEICLGRQVATVRLLRLSRDLTFRCPHSLHLGRTSLRIEILSSLITKSYNFWPKYCCFQRLRPQNLPEDGNEGDLNELVGNQRLG